MNVGKTYNFAILADGDETETIVLDFEDLTVAFSFEAEIIFGVGIRIVTFLRLPVLPRIV